MSGLEIKIPIHTYDKEGKDAKYIQSKLTNIRFNWTFYKESTVFMSDVRIIKKKGKRYKHELLRMKKMLEIVPQNKKLKEEYERYVKLDALNYIYDVELIFSGDAAIEVDIESNSVLFYNGPKEKRVKYRDSALLKGYIKDDMLDDFYEEKVKKLTLAIVMSIAIAYPEININSAITIVSFDEKIYEKERFFSCYPIHNDSVREYRKLFDSSITFNDCFDWIKKHTSLAGEKEKTPIIFSTLTYVFNREMHEIFVYSIIGLESVYAPNGRGISNTLQKNISAVFPNITKDMIKKLYTMRSKFVHGEMPIGNYPLIEEIVDVARDYDESSKLAVALLIATIRKFIENDASNIKFMEKLSFEYKSQ